MVKAEKIEKMGLLKYGPDVFISSFEIPKADILAVICDIKYEETFKNLLREDKKAAYIMNENGEEYNPKAIFTMGRKYLSKFNGGKVETLYKQKKGVGRFNAVGGLSLQGMTRQMRQTIADGVYRDYDIKNCHAVELLFLCDELKIKCDILRKYCENRAGFFADNGLEHNTGKNLMISLINGGSKAYKELEEPSDDLKEFYEDEIKTIHEEICDGYFNIEYKKFKAEKKKINEENEEYNSKLESDEQNKQRQIKKNYRARFINLLLCEIENKILGVIRDYIKEQEGERKYSEILIYDGLMLPADINFNLRECEAVIYKRLGIKIQIEEKIFADMFDIAALGYSIPKYIDFGENLKYYSDFKNLVNKDINLEFAKTWSDNALTWIENGGNGFFLTANLHRDNLTNEDIKTFEPVKKQKIFEALAVNCNIINDKYDIEEWRKFQALSEKKKNLKLKQMSEDEKMRIKKFLYKSLVGGMLNPGYVDSILRLRTNEPETPLKSFNYVEFYPYLSRKGKPDLKDTFNIFGGFPMEKIEIKQIYNFEESGIYKHIRDELMSGNDEKEFNHFLDHVADIIQDPANIKSNGHIFYSRQGMGKGMIGEFFSKLFGSNHVISFQNTDDYFSNFNFQNTNKLLKIFEELSEQGEAYKNHNILKGDMSKKKERIEKKGIDAYEIRHCARDWFFTNNDRAIFIEPDDRRFTIHTANNKYANNTEYFEPLWAEVRNEQFCRSAFEYFANRKYELANVFKCYINEHKKEQIKSCLPNGLKFMKEFIEEDFKGCARDGTNTKFKVKDVAQSFKNWCDDNGCKFNLGALKVQLKKINIEDKCVKYDGTNAKCYILNKPELLETFKNLLRDNKFEFDNLEPEE